MSYCSPSTRTRTKPCRRAARRSRSPSVLRSLMSGPRTSSRVPSGSARTWSTICWTRLALDRVAVRAVRDADPREQQAEVVVDLGDRADGRARVAAGALLVDRDRRRQAVDLVDVRLLHLAEELAGVRAQALDVAPLALGVDRVEREAGLAAAGQAGDDDEPVAREGDRDVLQVVFARAAHDELVLGHERSLADDRAFRTGVRASRARPRAQLGSSVAVLVIPPMRPAAMPSASGTPPMAAQVPWRPRTDAATPSDRSQHQGDLRDQDGRGPEAMNRPCTSGFASARRTSDAHHRVKVAKSKSLGARRVS